MPSFDVRSEVSILSDARVKQVEGIFDVAPAERSVSEWKVDLPIEEKDWQIGLIVGPSGAGKTTIARQAFGDHIISGYDWDPKKAVVSQFPEDMSIKDVTAALSSVGFSSPPSWLRPFSCLSNGEQFRVTLARALAEENDLFVIDEFTSVVDRTVARIGSHAVAKAIRKKPGKRMVAVSCHFDITEWLQPDWIYEPVGNLFSWRSLRRRPAISITVRRVDKAAWELFKRHHYLSSSLNISAACFLGEIEGQPCAFVAVTSFPHPRRSGYRAHRIVCLPDFQGAGIGLAVSDFVAAMYRAKGKPYFLTTGNPAIVQTQAHSKNWRLINTGNSARAGSANRGITIVKKDWKHSNRNTVTFEFCGACDRQAAEGFAVA